MIIDNFNLNERSIRLDTTQGNPIENAQTLEISEFEKNQFNAFDKWCENATIRSTPTPTYNCHGMTFASRRTGIFSSAELKKILLEDGYVKIQLEQVLPGDVIIYYSEDRDFEHSGIIISAPDQILKIPKVMSKWGKFAEMLHWANNCPYTFSNTEYYRIKQTNG